MTEAVYDEAGNRTDISLTWAQRGEIMVEIGEAIDFESLGVTQAEVGICVLDLPGRPAVEGVSVTVSWAGDRFEFCDTFPANKLEVELVVGTVKYAFSRLPKTFPDRAPAPEGAA